jgi:hypothetical protein
MASDARTAGELLEVSGAYWKSCALHAEGPEACLKILCKAVAAIAPCGTLIVHEFILNDTMDGPLFPALFSLNMLVGTPAGRSYSGTQIKKMLALVGTRDIRRIPVQPLNDSGLILGTV